MDMKYPIGTFQFDDEITSSITSVWINEIENLPRLLRDAVKDLDNDQLDTAYRSGGVDCSTSNTSPCRKSYECLCSL